MSSEIGLKKENLALSSLWGVARGISVHTLIYPLEVIKIRQQCSRHESKSLRIALAVFRQEGIGAFYRGLTPQLLKTTVKQIWCWPMITGIPLFLQRYSLGDLEQQALTGLSIAMMDATISTPLERAKMVSASTGTARFSLKNAYKDGWRGFVTHSSKLSVNWVTFLTAQKYFRDRSRTSPENSLSFAQLIKAGVQTALVVSLASAPFDIANTLKLAQNMSPSHFFSRKGIAKFYRGWPLSALALIIQNIASVIVIDRLSKYE